MLEQRQGYRIRLEFPRDASFLEIFGTRSAAMSHHDPQRQGSSKAPHPSEKIHLCLEGGLNPDLSSRARGDRFAVAD